MKILQITSAYLPDIGGANTHMGDLCSYLANVRKDKVVVLTFKPYSPHFHWIKMEKVNQNLTVMRKWWINSHLFDRIEKYPLLSFLNIATGMTLYTLLYMSKKAKKVEIVHAHGLNAAFAAKMAKMLFHKRTIVSTHALYNLDQRSVLAKLVKWVLKDVDVILALSEKSQQELIKIGLPKKQIGRFTYWVDQKIFKVTNKKLSRKQLKLPDKFTAIFVGRFIPMKGIDYIIKLAKEIPEINFLMIGGGLMEDFVDQQTKSLKNLYLFKNINNLEMPKFYNAADVCLVPSLYEEGYARVMCEALSCGVPVFGSKRGCIMEAINDQVGRLIEPTYQNFKKALLEIYQKPKLRNRLAKNAFTYSRQKYSVRNAEGIAKHYQ